MVRSSVVVLFYELFDLMNSHIRVPTRAAVLILSSRLVNTSRTSMRTLFPSRKLVNTSTLERTIMPMPMPAMAMHIIWRVCAVGDN